MHCLGQCPHITYHQRQRHLRKQFLIKKLYDTSKNQKQRNWLEKNVWYEDTCCCNGPDMRHIRRWWDYTKLELRRGHQDRFQQYNQRFSKKIYHLLAQDTITPYVRMQASLFLQNKLTPK